MIERTDAMKSNARARARRGVGTVRMTVLGAVAALALAPGCTSALAELDPHVGTTAPSPTLRAATAEPRVDGSLDPYTNSPDGATRKVGSDRFVRIDGRWIETPG